MFKAQFLGRLQKQDPQGLCSQKFQISIIIKISQKNGLPQEERRSYNL